MKKLILTIALLLLNFGAAHASEIQTTQDDALAAFSLESAATVCPADKISTFIDSAQVKGFIVSINSKVLASGLKSITLRFESSTRILIVQKPYEGLVPAENINPVCALSIKGLSGLSKTF